MRFRDRYDPERNGALVMKEVMLPICSPAYRDADCADGPIEANTIIRLADTPGDWAAKYPASLTKRSYPAKSLSFSDYERVVQTALHAQCIARGCATVASQRPLTGAVLPP